MLRALRGKNAVTRDTVGPVALFVGAFGMSLVGSMLGAVVFSGGERMRVYVMTTGVVFGLLAVAHLLRIVTEGPHLATDPFFILITVGAAGLFLWAWRLLRLSRRS